MTVFGNRALARVGERVEVFLANSLRSIRRQVSAPKERFLVSLERPVNREIVKSDIQISGWAKSFDNHPVRGRALFNDSVVVPLKFDHPRSDVSEFFSWPAEESQIGFQLNLPWEQVFGSQTLGKVVFEFFHDGEKISLGPIPVCNTALFTDPQQNMRIYLERTQSEVRDKIDIEGWVISLSPEPVEILIFCKDRVVSRILADTPRADVEEYFELEDKVCYGFSKSIPWSDLRLQQNEAELFFEVIRGGNSISIGPYRITKLDSPHLLHRRGEYKEVWERISADEKHAMIAVAGISDRNDFIESGVSSANTIADAINITETDDVLEIGCGAGRIGLALAPRSKSWIGADISGQMIAHAAENLKGHTNVKLVELRSASLAEFGDETIDKVYSSAVFMHLDEWDRYRYVCEAFRVLRPGGACYFDNINLLGEEGWSIFMNIAKYDAASRPEYVSKMSTPQELAAYLERAGFTDIRTLPGSHMVAVSGVKATS